MVTMHSQSVLPKVETAKSDVPSNTELCPKTLSSKLENLLQDLSDNEAEEDELPDLSFRAAAALQGKQDTQTADCVDSQLVKSAAEDNTKSVSSETVLPEQDSGYLTAPTVSSEEENTSESGTHDAKHGKGDLTLDGASKEVVDCSSEKSVQAQKESETVTEHEVLEQCTDEVSDKNEALIASHNKTLQEDKDILSTNNQTSGSANVESDKKLSVKSKLAALRISTAKPTLHAGPEFIIDLDSETSTPKPLSAGVSKLMERLMKQSSKKKKRRSKELEMR